MNNKANRDSTSPEAAGQSPDALLSKPVERRKLFAEVERQNWRLLAVGLVIACFLTLGIATLSYQVLKADTTHNAQLHSLLSQLFLGLLGVVTLGGLYLIFMQSELNKMRNQLFAAYAEASLLADFYPHDTLTGTLDRRALPDILKRESSRAIRYRAPFCLVLWDIRNFNRINETDGHHAGDEILKELARTLLKITRRTDIAIHYNADQFLCFLSGTERVGAEAFVRRVHAACHQALRLRNLHLDFGITAFSPESPSEALVEAAEQDLTSRRASEKAHAEQAPLEA